eukprot:3902660-Amphidinium_carterae.1
MVCQNIFVAARLAEVTNRGSTDDCHCAEQYVEHNEIRVRIQCVTGILHTLSFEPSVRDVCKKASVHNVLHMSSPPILV